MTDIKEPNTPPLQEMTDALSRALTPPLTENGDVPTDVNSREMLHDQAAALDALFRLTLSRSVGTQDFHRENKPHYMNDERITLALKMQQQCQNTLRAIHAIDYMDMLKLQSAKPDTSKGRGCGLGDQICPPTPFISGEQTGLGKNDT